MSEIKHIQATVVLPKYDKGVTIFSNGYKTKRILFQTDDGVYSAEKPTIKQYKNTREWLPIRFGMKLEFDAIPIWNEGKRMGYFTDIENVCILESV